VDIHRISHPLSVADPFRAEAASARRLKLVGFLTLLVVLGGASFVEYHRIVPIGPVVEGRVTAFRSASWDAADVPLTVELPDGTKRHIIAPRSVVIRCKVGSPISLQLGTYVRVTPKACGLS
jgi:hypothetical protein